MENESIPSATEPTPSARLASAFAAGPAQPAAPPAAPPAQLHAWEHYGVLLDAQQARVATIETACKAAEVRIAAESEAIGDRMRRHAAGRRSTELDAIAAGMVREASAAILAELEAQILPKLAECDAARQHATGSAQHFTAEAIGRRARFHDDDAKNAARAQGLAVTLDVANLGDLQGLARDAVATSSHAAWWMILRKAEQRAEQDRGGAARQVLAEVRRLGADLPPLPESAVPAKLAAIVGANDRAIASWRRATGSANPQNMLALAFGAR